MTTPTQAMAAVMDAFIREIGQPAKRPTAPKQTGQHIFTLDGETLDGDLEVDYEYLLEDRDDGYLVNITAARLYAPGSGVIALQLGDLRRVEDLEWQIAETLNAKIPAEEPTHARNCKCRDCLDNRGDWEYHARREA